MNGDEQRRLSAQEDSGAQRRQRLTPRSGSAGENVPDRAGNGSLGPDALLLALAAVILCYVWRVQDLFPILGALQLPLLSVALTGGLFLLDEDRRRRLRDIAGPVLRIVAGLGMLVAAGLPFALLQSNSFTFLTRDFLPNVLLLTALTAVAVRSEEDVRWLTGVHLVGAAMFCVMALTRYSPAGGGRLGGLTYYDANDLALLLVTVFPFALFYVLRGRSARVRLLAGGGLLLFMITLVQSGSRGGFIGFCVVAAWILVRYSSIPLGRRLGTLAACVLLLVFAGSDQFWDRMETILHPQDDYNWAGQSKSGRMEIWKRGIGYMLDRPLVGVGARNFHAAEGTLSRPGQLNQLGGPGFKWSAPHNAFVQVGAELGVFGLLLFLGLFLQGFRIAGRSPPALEGRAHEESRALRQAFRVSLIGLGVTAFFLSAAYKPIVFALMGLLAGLEKLDRIQRQPEGRRASRVVRLRRQVDSSPARSA